MAASFISRALCVMRSHAIEGCRFLSIDWQPRRVNTARGCSLWERLSYGQPPCLFTRVVRLVNDRNPIGTIPLFSRCIRLAISGYEASSFHRLMISFRPLSNRLDHPHESRRVPFQSTVAACLASSLLSSRQISLDGKYGTVLQLRNTWTNCNRN